MLDDIELATDQRRKNNHMLQCIKCKDKFVGQTAKNTKSMLYFHYKNNECRERTMKYIVSEDRQLKHKHHYTAYCKNFIICWTFEAVKKNICNLPERPRRTFCGQRRLPNMRLSLQYIVLVNDQYSHIFREIHIFLSPRN